MPVCDVHARLKLAKTNISYLLDTSHADRQCVKYTVPPTKHLRYDIRSERCTHNIPTNLTNILIVYTLPPPSATMPSLLFF